MIYNGLAKWAAQGEEKESLRIQLVSIDCRAQKLLLIHHSSLQQGPHSFWVVSFPTASMPSQQRQLHLISYSLVEVL